MKIKVTAQQLAEMGACHAAIDDFTRHFGGDTAEVEWTREYQIEIVKSPLRRWIGWAWRHGIAPMWSMRGADLTGADLTGAIGLEKNDA